LHCIEQQTPPGQGTLTRYADFVGAGGRQVAYRISAVDTGYRESPPSAPVSAATRSLSDDELLTMVQEATFRYYWEAADPDAGMAIEIRPGDERLIAVGSSGFGVMAIVAGVDRRFVTREQGDFAQAWALFEENLALHQIVGDRASVGFALIGLADVARDQGDAAGVHEYGEQALTILRELGVQWAIGFALNTLALGAYSAGDLTQALTLIRESEALFRGLKADSSLAEVLITQGQIVRAQGDNEAAYRALTEALRLAWAVGPRLLVAAALEGIANVVAAQQQAELAARLLAAASVLRVQMGAPVRPVDQAGVEQTLATARSRLGDAFAAVWVEAQTRPLEQILSTIPSMAAYNVLGDRSV